MAAEVMGAEWEGGMNGFRDGSKRFPGVDPIVERYESMPKERVTQELQNAGIDPQPAIDEVKALVQENLKDRSADDVPRSQPDR
jgi:hypothetical protein